MKASELTDLIQTGDSALNVLRDFMSRNDIGIYGDPNDPDPPKFVEIPVEVVLNCQNALSRYVNFVKDIDVM